MSLKLERLTHALVCPSCKGPLVAFDGGVRCEAEDLTFQVGPQGYLGFVSTRPDEGKGTTDEYAQLQHEAGVGVFKRYVKPWLEKESFDKGLEVGCGIGKAVNILAQEGYEAYGIDLPDLAKLWKQAGNDPDHFLIGNALQLPFPDGVFDAVWSLGVIEHIGTVDGFAPLSQGYQKDRERYASEILRVLKPGGRALIACPHKHFPIDIQHGPIDRQQHGPITKLAHLIDEWLWAKGKIQVHKTWGRYYLPSYREVERWFGRPAKPLPLKGYFGFSKFKHSKVLRPFLTAATFYVENLPASLRRTPLNPYMLAEIRK